MILIVYLRQLTNFWLIHDGWWILKFSQLQMQVKKHRNFVKFRHKWSAHKKRTSWNKNVILWKLVERITKDNLIVSSGLAASVSVERMECENRWKKLNPRNLILMAYHLPFTKLNLSFLCEICSNFVTSRWYRCEVGLACFFQVTSSNISC